MGLLTAVRKTENNREQHVKCDDRIKTNTAAKRKIRSERSIGSHRE